MTNREQLEWAAAVLAVVRPLIEAEYRQVGYPDGVLDIAGLLYIGDIEAPTPVFVKDETT